MTGKTQFLIQGIEQPDLMQDKALLTLRFSDGQSVGSFAGLLSSLDDLHFTDALINRQPAHHFDIRRLHIGSPGLLEVIGSLNPLKFIYDMTKLILDHLRFCEFQRLSYQERELQSEKTKIEILDAKAKLLQKLGVPEVYIQERIAEALLGEKVSKYTVALDVARVESVDYEELPD